MTELVQRSSRQVVAVSGLGLGLVILALALVAGVRDSEHAMEFLSAARVPTLETPDSTVRDAHAKKLQTPEPTALLLLGTGLVSTGVAVRRLRRSRS